MRRVRFLPFALVLLFLIGCATSWQGKATQGYESLGLLGKTYYSVAKSNCEATPPVLTPDQCAKLKQLNNDCRRAYLASGDALILAIETTDAVQQQKLLVEYNKLIGDFNKLLLQFVTMLRDFKAIK